MFNIQPHIDRLELLKEYMNYFIDGLPTRTMKDRLREFNETGCIVFYASEHSRMTFEQFIEYKKDDALSVIMQYTKISREEIIAPKQKVIIKHIN
jgi:hypothetical protein